MARESSNVVVDSQVVNLLVDALYHELAAEEMFQRARERLTDPALIALFDELLAQEREHERLLREGLKTHFGVELGR